jgi:hypothetical protein
MTHISNSTILVVGGKILTTDDFVFKARQESVDDVIDDFGPPIINFIAPVYIMEGEEREIIMSGNRTYNPLSLGISGNGITVEDVHVDSDGQVTARVEVAAGAAASADDLRSITVTTLPGQSDSDGESIEQTSTFANELRIYFSTPSLASVAYADAGNSPIVNQGDTVTATLTGTKFYDQSWDEQYQMRSSLDAIAGVNLQSMTVDSDTQATAVFTVDADAGRGSSSIQAQTHSGQSGTLASNLTIFYSAPTIASLTEQGGADMVSISAGTTKALRLSGSRLEGVDAAGRIEIGQVDAAGNFNPSPAQEDGTENVVLSTYATISNVSASTPAGTGANHTVDFDLIMAQDIPSDLQNIGFRITALDAAGSLQTVLSLAEAFSIDAAEPTISSIEVAGRPAGDVSSYVAGSGALQVTVNGANFYGTDLSASVSGDATGITVSNVNKATSEIVTMDINIAADVDPSVRDITLTFEGGSTTSSNAASKLEIILPAPTLSTDPAQNHLTLDRPNTGAHVHTFTIDGTNLMNIWDAGNTSDGLRATDGDFEGYYQTADTMGATLTSGGNAVAGLVDFSLTATSETKADGTVTVQANASLGLVDLQVTTRSGQTANLAGVLDIIPGDPEFANIAPDHIMEGSPNVVLTLAGANFHPAGDGNPAGSSITAMADLYYDNPLFAPTITNPVGGEEMMVEIMANNGNWRLVRLDTGEVTALALNGVVSGTEIVAEYVGNSGAQEQIEVKVTCPASPDQSFLVTKPAAPAYSPVLETLLDAAGAGYYEVLENASAQQQADQAAAEAVFAASAQDQAAQDALAAATGAAWAAHDVAVQAMIDNAVNSGDFTAQQITDAANAQQYSADQHMGLFGDDAAAQPGLEIAGNILYLLNGGAANGAEVVLGDIGNALSAMYDVYHHGQNAASGSAEHSALVALQQDPEPLDMGVIAPLQDLIANGFEGEALNAGQMAQAQGMLGGAQQLSADINAWTP